jgi:hypothetical protein
MRRHFGPHFYYSLRQPCIAQLDRGPLLNRPFTGGQYYSLPSAEFALILSHRLRKIKKDVGKDQG